MNGTRIPLYRAKKSDSDKYVIGYLNIDGRGYYKISNYLPPIGYSSYLIDETTLAIHLPEMILTNGTKIFASLSDDGTGSDQFKHINWIGRHDERNIIYACFNAHGLAFYTADDGKKLIRINLELLKLTGLYSTPKEKDINGIP